MVWENDLEYNRKHGGEKDPEPCLCICLAKTCCCSFVVVFFFPEKNVLCVLLYLQIPSKLRVYLRNLNGDIENDDLKSFLVQAQRFESCQMTNIHCNPTSSSQETNWEPVRSAFVTFTSTELRNKCIHQLDKVWYSGITPQFLPLVCKAADPPGKRVYHGKATWNMV